MMILKFASILVAAATLGAPAVAAPIDPAAVVKSREAVAHMSPSDGGALVELAAAYQRAGRTADANTALRRVLTLDNMMLETPTGDAIWSHQVARQVLAHDVALTQR